MTALREQGWTQRLWSRHAAVLLGRNTVVSIAIFLLGLGVLWLLVEYGGVHALIATAITFLAATTIHYALGRAWIFRSTDRKLVPGYGLFLVNALLGLAVTVVLMAVLLRWTPTHYLVARTFVSLFAGLAMFLSNAIWNFRKL